MNNRHLFLFGGSPPFNQNLGKKFANLSLNKMGRVAILYTVRDGWMKYMKKYTSELENNGLTNFYYLPLSPNPDHTTLKELLSCTGIIICGGDTELYHNYIVNSALGEHIKMMYNQGIPIAGFSAGALIIPNNCVIPPVDNFKNEQLFLDGLGLINNCVISVHFTKWNEKENLLSAIEKTNVPIGYGIDDEGCLYFENEFLIEVDCENFYRFSR